MACVVTNLAASVGGITWMLWDYRLERKWSVVGFCSGAIAGLVGITPAAGFVGAPAAVAIGFVAGTGCNFATKLKFLFGIDETLDVFASHGIGGMIGSMMTALLAQASVAGFDGTEIDGGWPDHHYIQLGYQLAEITATFAWSFTITSLICWVMHFIPGLRLRANEESEIVGIDDAYLGEFAYDYVGIDPELRLHRIGSGPTMTSGDVMEGNGMHEKRHGLASSPEMAASDSETSNEHAVGGGRHDQ
jgi:Amt family ammonium transporter